MNREQARAILANLDLLAMLLLALLFGITFIGVQVASWTGSRS